MPLSRLLFTLVLGVAFTVISGQSLTAQEAPSYRKAKAQFDAADRALNAAYAAAKAALSESEFSALKEDQRAWVEHRDYLARSPMYTGADFQGELPLDSPDYLSAAAELAESRAAWLRARVRSWAAEEDLTGVWSDSYGGRLEVVQREGALLFVLTCVRGPTSHTGGLAGTLEWNDPIGWYSDEGLQQGKDDVTNLSFIARDGHLLEVIGANTGHYHGARAYFSGTYVKVEKLSAKAQAKVARAAKSGELPEE